MYKIITSGMNFVVLADSVAEFRRGLVDESFRRTAMEVKAEREVMKREREDHFFHTHFEDECDECFKEREQCANEN